MTNENNVFLAKKVLNENCDVLYGIFGFINTSGYFPPLKFLNMFLCEGHDPCDQDRRMSSWEPFELSEEEYSLIIKWWRVKYPKTVEDNLGVENWNDWVQKILEV